MKQEILHNNHLPLNSWPLNMDNETGLTMTLCERNIDGNFAGRYTRNYIIKRKD